MALAQPLRNGGHQVALADDGEQGIRRLQSRSFDLVIADVRLPDIDGFVILEYARSRQQPPDVILMTAHGAIDDAVRAIRRQATDYLVKPFDSEELMVRVQRIEKRHALDFELRKSSGEDGSAAHGLVGRSAALAHVRAQIDAIAPSSATVLITGESGTGKELVARALHNASGRSNAPFIALNCAAFPDTLLEAELFGYTKGAFTGAGRAREGRLLAAHGGTLFLDEIAEMQPQSQAKLLRVLQDHSFSPLGTNHEIVADIRILSATNQHLKELVDSGRFREDLYYRIKVMSIELPPLRERPGDLGMLTGHFLRKFTHDGPVPAIPEPTWSVLSSYSFPGNVRELEHAVHHALILAGAEGSQKILRHHLPQEFLDHPSIETAPYIRPLRTALQSFEREHILDALRICRGSRKQTAKRLGISRKNLWEKLRNHNISDSDLS